MIEVVRTTLARYRFLRVGRRRVGQWVRRLGAGQRSEPLFKPMLDDTALAKRLGWEGAAEPSLEEGNAERLVYEGARWARCTLGPRFFVSPNDISRLSAELEAFCPGSRAALLRQVRRDVSEGIPLYAEQGPKLGSSFPWASLPTGPGGDPMYAKRPHRFAFAPRHAWASVHAPEAAEHLRGMIDAWIDCAVHGRSRFCHDSNLGVIQRIMALSWSWAFLAGRPEEESAEGLGLEWRILQIIESDIRFLEPLLGRSVANNHLLADWFAGWYLGLLFPEFLDSPDTGNEQRWCDELLAQTYSDGGSFEHSSHYHEFACEMGTAYLLLSSRNGRAVDPTTAERIKALLTYQCALGGSRCHPLPIGNAVEDTLFPLDLGEGWCNASLRECYRALFRSDITPAPTEDPTVVRAFWLLGGAFAPLTAGTSSTSLSGHFAEAGLFVFEDEEMDARLTFRTGPAPDTDLTAGHMHSDLLSVYLEVTGCPVLVDAGTYTYRSHSEAWGKQEPHWRAYFAGPAAHNGFCVDEQDPLGRIRGDFRRRSIAHRVPARRVGNDRLCFVEGYFQSDDGYDGMRRTCLHLVGEFWLLLNKFPLPSRAGQERWMGFQLDPEVVPHDGDQRLEIRKAGIGAVECYLVGCQSTPEPEVLCGSIEPLGGWVSPRYGELRPAHQLRYRLPDSTPATTLLLGTNSRYGDARIIQSDYGNTGASFVHVSCNGVDDYFLTGPGSVSSGTSAQGELEFDGDLLWLRVDGKGRGNLQWFGGSRLLWPDKGIRIELLDATASDFTISSDNHVSIQLEKMSVFEWPASFQ